MCAKVDKAQVYEHVLKEGPQCQGKGFGTSSFVQWHCDSYEEGE